MIIFSLIICFIKLLKAIHINSFMLEFELQNKKQIALIQLLKSNNTIIDLPAIIKSLSLSQKKHSLQCFQTINPDLISGKQHLQQAINETLCAFERKSNYSDNFNLELLVRLNANRRINNALTSFGLKENSKTVLLIGVASASEKNNLKKAFDEFKKTFDLIESNKTDNENKKFFNENAKQNLKLIKEHFSINENELKNNSLEDLVCEKIALLELRDWICTQISKKEPQQQDLEII